MSEGEVLFDVLDVSRGVGWVLLEFGLSFLFPMLLLAFGLRGFRKAQAKAGKLLSLLLGGVGLLSLALGVISLFADPLADKYRRDIDSGSYSQTQGTVSNLTESTIWAGRPVASFEVDGHVFEYARGSENCELNIGEHGSILANGAAVKIWFKGKKILKVFSAD